MPFGAFAPLPFRLGDSGKSGLTAEQFSRVTADLVAISATLPLAVLRIYDNSSAFEVSAYRGRNGVGLSYAPSIAYTGGRTTLTWPSVIETEDGRFLPWVITHAVATSSSPSARQATCSVTANTVAVDSWNLAGSAVSSDYVSVVVYGQWGNPSRISDYDGDVDKENDFTENPIPYAAMWYSDIQQQRGPAYTSKADALVSAENLAMARLQATIANRYPDKLRANSTPLGAGESLPYWQEYLAISRRPSESDGDVRRKLLTLYRATSDASYSSLETAVRSVLGDAFVSLELQHGTALSSPSDNTYWPTINPGPVSYDLGGGAWLSDRAQVIINVTQPGGMTQGEYNQLLNVQLFNVVDRMLPAWASGKWVNETTAIVWDGFYWDDGSLWDERFDWGS